MSRGVGLRQRILRRLQPFDCGDQVRMFEAAHDDAQAPWMVGVVPALRCKSPETRNAFGDGVPFRQGTNRQAPLNALVLVGFGLA